MFISRAQFRLPLFFAVAMQTAGALLFKTPILTLAAIVDAAIHYKTEKSITAFNHYFSKKKMSYLPSFTLNEIANVIRLATLAWSTGYLMHELSKQGKIPAFTFRQAYQASFIIALMSWGIPMAGVSLLTLFIRQLNKVRAVPEKIEAMANKDEILKEVLKKVSVEWNKPRGEQLAQITTLLESVVNCALMVFTDKKPLFATLAVLNLYTLAQMTKRDWLCITRDVEDFRYILEPIFFRDISQTDSPGSDDCSICLEKPSHRYFFCERHSYDQACLVSLFVKATENFKVEGIWTRHEANRDVTYSGSASESIIPKCPLCRLPTRASLTIQVCDKIRKIWCSSSVTWIKEKH